MIDSEVDTAHPDLAGAISPIFYASAKEKPHAHGTGMAGAIAARRTIWGRRRDVGLITVRRSAPRAISAEGTTFNILKGLDWAASQGAGSSILALPDRPIRACKMRCSRPTQKGMVLIAAAGNAGPNSPPLFPAADPT